MYAQYLDDAVHDLEELVDEAGNEEVDEHAEDLVLKVPWHDPSYGFLNRIWRQNNVEAMNLNNINGSNYDKVYDISRGFTHGVPKVAFLKGVFDLIELVDVIFLA